MSDAARISSLEQMVARLQRDLDRLPLYLPPPRDAQRIQIIGGNTVNGVDCILYAAAAPAITALLDPDVDASYDTGFGRGWLMSSVGLPRRVLVWHEFGGYQSPVQGGYVADVRDQTVLPVTSGPDTGKLLTFYRITYPS